MLRLLQRKSLARKYAIAFLQTYHEQDDLFAVLDTMEELIDAHSLFFKILHFSNTSAAEKKEKLARVTKEYNLPKHLLAFLDLLIAHKVTYLISIIIRYIRTEHKKRNNLIDVFITTSHQLEGEKKQELEQTISQKIPGTLTYFYTVDERLIAGIKIKTDTYYWEETLAQRIREIENSLSV